MRKYGSGTLQQLPSGKWRFRLPQFMTGRAKWSAAYETKREAEEQLGAAIHLSIKGELVPEGGLTLGKYGARWLAACKHRTVGDDRGRWRRFVAGRPFAQMALDKIQPGHVKRFMESVARTRKQVSAKGKRYAHRTSNEFVSRQTVRHVYGLLRRCFSEAIVDGHIKHNPCNGYRLANDVEKWRMQHAPGYLSANEIDQLLSSFLPLAVRLIYEVAIFTGMRAGELWGLRWKDLQLDGPRATCRVSRSYGGPTKNSRTRAFALLPRARAALLRWRDLAKFRGADDFVFPGRGGRMHARGYDNGWSEHREQLGLRRELTFHSLRHTLCSHLVMGTWGRKWTLDQVQQYIGHSSISVTQRYAHLSPDHLAELAAATVGSISLHQMEVQH